MGPLMRFATYDHGDGASRLGLVGGEGQKARVLDLGAVAGLVLPDLASLVEQHPDLTLAELFRDLSGFEPLIEQGGAPLESVRLLAPVLHPAAITCLGLNYRSHAEEQRVRLPEVPLLFAKARTSIVGPRGPIRIEPGQDRVDYEVELCLVVGRPGYKIPRERAREHLLGYTVACDVSDRAAQFSDRQWYRGKSYPTFCPIGPVVVTPDAIDPGHLRLTTRLNGRLMQDATTEELIFDVDDIVVHASRIGPLEVGDLILTGTPAGVGVFRDPQVFLRPGDRLECAIEGIGALGLTIELAT